MRFLVALLILGVVYGRKAFAYLELAPAIFIIEATLLLMAATIAVGAIRRALLDPVPTWLGHQPALRPVGAGLLGTALGSLGLAVAKGVFVLAAGGEQSALKELPILVYPAFFLVLVAWCSSLSRQHLDRLTRLFERAVLFFPIFLAALHLSGTFSLLTFAGIDLWPNNNFLLAACLLVAVFFRHRYPAWLLWPSACAAIVSLLVEAQRGAFLCLAAGAVLLVRRPAHVVRMAAGALAIVAAISLLGSRLSDRFEGGVDDIGEFVAASVGSTDDARYSSTGHRQDMWLRVVGDAFADPANLLFGKPPSEAIVSEAWRNPHNGYLSALGRGGVIGFFFYVLLAFASVRMAWSARRDPEFPLVRLLFLCGCVDAATQTVFDSPYSLFLVMLSGALAIMAEARQPRAARVREGLHGSRPGPGGPALASAL